MKLTLILLALLSAPIAQATVIEPDDSQTPACYAGYDVDKALRDLLRGDLYAPRFSKELSRHDGTNVFGVQVFSNGKKKVTVIPPCGFADKKYW